MNAARTLCLSALLLGTLGCHGNSGTKSMASVQGLGAACDGGCGAGQDCVTANQGGVSVQTCQIVCEHDGDCPAGFHCNLPANPPDSIANVCKQ